MIATWDELMDYIKTQKQIIKKQNEIIENKDAIIELDKAIIANLERQVEIHKSYIVMNHRKGELMKNLEQIYKALDASTIDYNVSEEIMNLLSTNSQNVLDKIRAEIVEMQKEYNEYGWIYDEVLEVIDKYRNS